MRKELEWLWHAFYSLAVSKSFSHLPHMSGFRDFNVQQNLQQTKTLSTSLGEDDWETEDSQPQPTEQKPISAAQAAARLQRASVGSKPAVPVQPATTKVASNPQLYQPPPPSVAQPAVQTHAHQDWREQKEGDWLEQRRQSQTQQRPSTTRISVPDRPVVDRVSTTQRPSLYYCFIVDRNNLICHRQSQFPCKNHSQQNLRLLHLQRKTWALTVSH
jgi:type IV secretory pathway VirB10-like protein